MASASAWATDKPIFIDFETQSIADINEVGGRLYAHHPSTRILITVLAIDDVFHVWIPDYIRCKIPAYSRLWPHELQPAKKVYLHRGNEVPEPIAQAATLNRPFVAHNAYGFDQFIWERFHSQRPEWLDSMYLARISGRQAGLDSLSKRLLGKGKDRAKKLLPKLTKAKETVMFGKRANTYPFIVPGDLAAFTTYAIADVELLSRLWKEFEELQVEVDIINTHNAINNRGVAVDKELISIIDDVSKYSQTVAVTEIARLTRGKLHADNIRSVQQVHDWLQSWGVYIYDESKKDSSGKSKLSLRKDVVQRYIDSPYIIEENLMSAREIPPLVIKVLELRMKALRITDAKVKKAKSRITNGRIYDVHTYHQAHTGRASSQGVQIHNLPRPPKGLNIQRLLDKFDTTQFKSIRNDSKLIFDFIKEELKQQYELATKPDVKEAIEELTVDDVCSALIRPSLIASEGKRLVLCDFSTVEARGVAWIADEPKLMAVFHRQDKGLSKFGPYEQFASEMFGVRIEDVDSTQRQVAKSAVLGCGYGLGPDKFRVYAAAMGADLTKAGVTAEAIINKYRDTYTKIAGFRPQKEHSNYGNFRTGGIWHKLEKAVKDCVSSRVPQEAGKCQWHMMGKDLVCILPSGRHIHYPDARIEDIVPAYCYTLGLPLIPKATVTYQSTTVRKSLYGGLITENVVQAICRDLLMCALVEMELMELFPVMHVHDEGVAEVLAELAEDTLRIMVKIMSTTPTWCPGFPLNCEGFISPRFVKKAFKGYTELTGTHTLKV